MPSKQQKNPQYLQMYLLGFDFYLRNIFTSQKQNMLFLHHL